MVLAGKEWDSRYGDQISQLDIPGVATTTQSTSPFEQIGLEVAVYEILFLLFSLLGGLGSVETQLRQIEQELASQGGAGRHLS